MIANRVLLTATCLALLPCASMTARPVSAETPLPRGLKLPPLPVLGPTALCADAGNGKAFLRWNLQIEDERVVGWRVLMLKPERKTVSAAVLTEPQFVVQGLQNGTAYEFTVVGVLKTRSVTPPSNTATVMPRDPGTAKVVSVSGSKFTAGEFKDLGTGPHATRIVFPDGQELLYDNCRPVDWKTRDGQHLIYPKPFGNGLDIGQFDARGLAKVIPAEPAVVTESSDPRVEDPARPLDPEYRDAQFGTPHPDIGDPMTLPLGRKNHDAPVRWYPPSVDGDRVTLHYALPLRAMGYRAWSMVVVWETWWPLERERHGTTYHGFARLVEVEMPSALKDGYQVMLNNGFGPDGGTRRDVVSYSTGFRTPVEIVDFSGDTNNLVVFQYSSQPRQSGYHPAQNSLQSSPLIFYDWGQGSLTIAARSLYYFCSNASSSYPQQGADGVWPNLSWDLGQSGRRIAVETVEYLYTGNTRQPLPQRYNNARFEALGDVSRRMGVQDRFPAVASDQHLGEMTVMGGPVPYAQKYIDRLKGLGCDAFGAAFHDTWLSNPYIVDERYVLDPEYKENRELAAMCDLFRQNGYLVGYWYRPEVVKTSIATLLSDRIPELEGFYHTHGVAERQVPNAAPRMREVGIQIVREHPHWIRRQRDGAWPVRTPYQWVPMSMAGGWWERVMWPTLVTSRKLGFSYILQDGGFGGLAGVDYAPMLDGRTDHALPCQPFWWRMFRSAHAAGIDLIGECTVGWKGGFVSMAGQHDEHFLWMFQCGMIYGHPFKAEQTHKLYQLYNAQRLILGTAPVRLFAIDFYRKHPPPDWVEMVDLRQGDEIEVTAAKAEAPLNGEPAGDGQVKYKVRPWTWTDAIWHYHDGRQVVYPAYEKVDWTKVEGQAK